MGYEPRDVPPNSMVEITMRTVQGRMLLRPSPELDARILAVLGRALFLFPVLLHAFVYMSNHAHLLLTTLDGKQLASFLQHLNRNVTVAVQEVTGWEGPVWQGRPTVTCILDDESAQRRLKYLCSNSVKEGLVASPEQWPGVSSASALLHQTDIVTRWQTAADRRAARCDGAPVDSAAYCQINRIRLSPLPSMRGLSKDARRSFFSSLFVDIANEGAKLRNGAPPLGRRRILAQSPRTTKRLERTAAPKVYAATWCAAHSFCELRRVRLDAYRAASELLARGQLDVPFPPGTFPPRRPFVPWPILPSTPSSAPPGG